MINLETIVAIPITGGGLTIGSPVAGALVKGGAIGAPPPASGGPSGSGLVLEDGSGYLLLEDGSYLLLE